MAQSEVFNWYGGVVFTGPPPGTVVAETAPLPRGWYKVGVVFSVDATAELYLELLILNPTLAYDVDHTLRLVKEKGTHELTLPVAVYITDAAKFHIKLISNIPQAAKVSANIFVNLLAIPSDTVFLPAVGRT